LPLTAIDCALPTRAGGHLSVALLRLACALRAFSLRRIVSNFRAAK